jgi:subtilisin
VNYALSKGVVVVAAAGNCGVNPLPATCTNGLNTVEYPAANTGVIAVGATTTSNARASYSNDNSYVVVAAPGSGILSTYSTDSHAETCSSSPSAGYCLLSGTSMAAPHVAAVAALLFSKCPSDTPTDVRNRITAVANTSPVTGFAHSSPGLVKAGLATAGCT